jgi:hypothetical protein
MRYERSTTDESPVQGPQSEEVIQSLDHLLAMAQRYQSEGNLRQAMAIYWTLSEDHFETTQGREAQGSLIAMADHFENDGLRHQARAIYERLLVDSVSDLRTDRGRSGLQQSAMDHHKAGALQATPHKEAQGTESRRGRRWDE